MTSSSPYIGSDEFERIALEALQDMNANMDPLAMQVCFNLIRATNRVVKDLETAVSQAGSVSFAGSRVLFSLKAAGPLHPNALARLSGVSTASMSSLLNTLEKRALIIREPDAEDKRRTIVHLTELGINSVAQQYIANHDREKAWKAGLTDAEARILIELLRKLISHRPPRIEPGAYMNVPAPTE